MIVEQDFDIVGSFKAEKYKQYDCQRTINCYEEFDSSGKKVKALFPTAGVKKKLTFPLGTEVRRLFEHKDYVYAVVSNIIYKIDRTYFYYEISSPDRLKTAYGFISIDSNEVNQILFSDGAAGYLYNEAAGTFVKVTDENFPRSPGYVIYFDGYFIINDSGTAQFFVSKTNDGAVWTPRRQFSLTSRPDIIVGFASVNRRLLVFGKYVTEIWYSNPAPNETASDPLLRDNNVLINMGCASQASIATGYGMVVFLSNNDEGDNTLVMSEGTSISPVLGPEDTRRLDYQISQYKKVDDAVGYLFKDDGHLFYHLTFPSENVTWQIDLTTKKIQEIQWIDDGRFIAQCHAYFNSASNHLVGSYKEPVIYHLSTDYGTYDGVHIRRLRIGPHLIDQNYKRIRILKIQIDTEHGVADANGYGSEPEMFLAMSEDGGISYDSYLRKSLGKIGQFKKSVIWYRLGGFSRDVVFKLEWWHALPILGGSITYDVKNK